MQSFTIVLLVAAVACANAGLLAQPAAVAYTGLTSAYAPVVRSYAAPAVSTVYNTGYNTYPAYSAYAAPAYSAYAAAPLTTYGGYATTYNGLYGGYAYGK